MKQHEKFFDFPWPLKRARKESRKVKHSGRHVGAAITKGGRLLSVGRNKLKTHPALTTFSIHAEQDAILSRIHCDDMTGATMWVFRETADGMPAMAKPCDKCVNMMLAFGIKKAVYSVPYPPYIGVTVYRGET